MTTSGVSTWTQTRDDIIKTALQNVGLLGPQQTPRAWQSLEGAKRLNGLVKAFQNDEVFLWTVEETTETLTASDLVIGTDGKVYQCIRDHTSAAGTRPITGADWSTYWLLQDPASSPGAAWLTATPYHNIGQFTVPADTIAIENAFLRDSSHDYPVEMIDRNRYIQVRDKYNQRRPDYCVFDKKLSGVCYFYPIPDLTTYVFHFDKVRALEDFVTTTDNPDFPVRWIKALEWALSADWAPSAGLLESRVSQMQKYFEYWYQKAKGADREDTDSDFIKGAY